MTIDGPQQLPGIGPSTPTPPSTPGNISGGRESSGASFADILRNSISEVNELQTQADAAIRELSHGRTDNVSAVVSQVEKADLAFRALLAVRNKLIDAYEEIGRLRV